MKARAIMSISVALLLLAVSLLFGSILLFRLFVLSTLILAAGYLWVNISLRRLSVTAGSLPEHLQVGDEFFRDLTLTNNSRLPRLWLTVQDQTDLGQQDNVLVNIRGHDKQTWQTRFTCTRRGLAYAGPVNVTATDPLGIFSKRISLGERQPLIVYPRTVDLPHFKFSSFSDFGYGSGFQSVSRISPNASSVREFNTGDSLRHIHWPSALRTGKLMVKMFDADRAYNAAKESWVLLDMNEAAHYGRNRDTTDEQAITIAASVASDYLQGGMRVGLMAGDANRTLLLPARGELQRWKILEKLALTETDWNGNLLEIVNNNLDKLRDNPLLIIIATTTSVNLPEVIRLLRRRVDTVVVILLDAASWTGNRMLTEMGRTLAWTGAQVYTVYKGDDLAKALDSKATHLHPVTV